MASAMSLGKGCLAMDEWEDELAGEEIERFIQLQAEEGKTAEEAIEALMKLVGGKMPEFRKEEAK